MIATSVCRVSTVVRWLVEVIGPSPLLALVWSRPSLYLHVNMKARANSGQWTIGELAARFDLPTNVLRHWETLGLLAPERDSSGYRRYGREDLVRVAVVLRNQAAGMSLEQIAVLLDGEARGRHEVLEAHLRDLDERARSIERSRAMTEHALRCRAHDIAACPRFAGFVDDLVEGRAPDILVHPELLLAPAKTQPTRHPRRRTTPRRVP
jgi:DNA-binding transcriptional MerR regulator